MQTIHLVSHTHWDREWYLPFQQFRLKLVQMVDHLLALMESDPEYLTFMLDGQTIIVEDYLQLRPEKEQLICDLVQAGRLQMGPWHVLPDEFLVSPESILRNLLIGDQVARRFGPKMQVGYIPDPFGHIGQMPQILRGFDIESCSLQRGLDDEPCEFWWQGSDGSRVLLLYLRDGYGNAALLPGEPGETYATEVRRLSASLEPFCRTPHVLLMHGTDHMPAAPTTAAAIASTRGQLNGARLVHSTLPAYVQAVQSAIEESKIEIPTIRGELRSSKRFHLLPGVLSARIWIKQRNHTCENLLEKWAEPFSALASLLLGEPQPGSNRLSAPPAFLRLAWRLLLENHPHDSICGCGVDQVHQEMAPRFDQVEQIGEQITLQSLEALAENFDSRPPQGPDFDGLISSVAVFNPAGGPRTEVAEFQVSLPGSSESIEVLDENGDLLPSQVVETTVSDLTTLTMDRDQLMTMLSSVTGGSIANVGPIQDMALQGAEFERRGPALYIYATLSKYGKPDEGTLQHALEQFMHYLSDENLQQFVLQARTRTSRVQFLARAVPARGWKTFWLRPAGGGHEAQPADDLQPEVIENEFFTLRLAADGALDLSDKRTGAEYRGLNRFVDGGDCGDEYNFCPPARDQLLTPELLSARLTRSGLQQSIEVELLLPAPAGLSADRQSRAEERVPLHIYTRAVLLPGVPRVDIHTRVENNAQDHRLRVHFPAPLETGSAAYDGHFEVVSRPLGLPAYDDSWAEAPRPEKPQRNFTSISNGQFGLTLANRGLREIEVLPAAGGAPETTLALTLLRCVGWLSREDFPLRKGHAGPGMPTPGAQMIGTWAFDYTLIPHAGGWQNAFSEAEAFTTPLRAVAAGIHPGTLPARASFLEVHHQSFPISTLKAAEDGRGVILRGCNLSGDTIQVSLRPGWVFRRVEKTNLAERTLEELPVDEEGRITFAAGPQQIVTLRIE